MLDLKLLEEVVPDIEDRTYGDLQEIKLLTEEEVKDLAIRNEVDDLCQDDILNLCVTAMNYMKFKNSLMETVRETPLTSFPFKPCINDKPYVSKGKPLEVRFETTGVEKCVPVTCEERETADDIMGDAHGRLMAMGSYFDKV